MNFNKKRTNKNELIKISIIYTPMHKKNSTREQRSDIANEVRLLQCSKPLFKFKMEKISHKSRKVLLLYSTERAGDKKLNTYFRNYSGPCSV